MTRSHPVPSATALPCGSPVARPVPAWPTRRIPSADLACGDSPVPSSAWPATGGADRPPAADTLGGRPRGPSRRDRPAGTGRCQHLPNADGHGWPRPTRRLRADLAACPHADHRLVPDRAGTGPGSAVVDGHADGRPGARAARAGAGVRTIRGAWPVPRATSNRTTTPTLESRAFPADRPAPTRSARSAARRGTAHAMPVAGRPR
jgi:hypothetical protein